MIIADEWDVAAGTVIGGGIAWWFTRPLDAAGTYRQLFRAEHARAEHVRRTPLSLSLTSGAHCVSYCVDAMPTNLAIDDKLLDEAKKLGRHATKRAAVNEALAEYVARRKRRRVLDFFGKVDWDTDYDHKRERRRR